MTLAEYLRDQRTLSQEEVDRRTAVHDSEDLRPEERIAFDTGSMKKVQ